MINSTAEVGTMARKRECMECGNTAPELSIYQRVCYKCHKSAEEARARPHTETNTQKRARLKKAICSHFDTDYLARMKMAKEMDDERRRERQARIAERKEKEMAIEKKKKFENKPRYSLDIVQQYHAYIMEVFDRYDCFGTGMSGESLRKAANSISRKTKIPYKILCTTLSANADDYMSAAAVDRIATRIAGNYLTLRKNIPLIDLAAGVPVEGWALIRIIGVNTGYTHKKGVPGFKMYAEILTGELANTTMVAGYSMGICKKFGKKLGIKRNELEYFSPKFLTNLHGWTYIAETNRESRPREMDSNPAHKEHNRKLTEGRMNIAKCPRHYKPDKYPSCVQCPLGYSGGAFSSCKYAVRRDRLKK